MNPQMTGHSISIWDAAMSEFKKRLTTVKKENKVTPSSPKAESQSMCKWELVMLKH